jgi:hypothetical protein
MAQLGSSRHGKGLLWDHGKTQKTFGVLGSRLNFLAAQIQLQGFCSQNLPDPRNKNCPKIFGALSHPEFLSCVASCQIQHNKHSQFSH